MAAPSHNAKELKIAGPVKPRARARDGKRHARTLQRAQRAAAPVPDENGLTIVGPPRPRAHARDGTRHARILRNNKPPHRRRLTPTAKSRIKPLRRLGRAPCSALPSGSQLVGASSPSAFRVPLQAPVDPCTGCGLGRRRRMPRALHPQSDAGPPAPPKGEATRSQTNAVEGQATTRVSLLRDTLPLPPE